MTLPKKCLASLRNKVKKYIPRFAKVILREMVATWVKSRIFIETFGQRFRRARESDYIKMQKKFYVRAARRANVLPGDLFDDVVVGSWREHDSWTDYEAFLFRYVDPAARQVALDFGCGPGRNIRRFSDLFGRIDGADISSSNLSNAKVFLDNQISLSKKPNLFLTNGNDCGDAPTGNYDFVFSTITLQHICSYSVRFKILEDIYRVLKPGGRISIQMGYGSPSPNAVGYYEDFFSARETNRGCDTEISDVAQPKGDFTKIGFIGFENWVRPVGPGDIHPSWIFMTAVKPIFAE